MKLSKKKFGKLTVHYRAGVGEPSSDEQALDEVLVKKCYRRVRSGFDVMPGERWLDLGANIGAFAVYCAQRGADVICFEPDPGCFQILRKNATHRAILFNMAVTAVDAKTIHFKKSSNPQNHYRGTTLSNVPGNYIDCPPVKNLYAGKLQSMFSKGFDGIKMDIEGSEAGILDEWLLPPTKKLVMEYHTSRDSSVANLKDRLEMLRGEFINLKYPKAFDEVIARGEAHYRPRFDQLIFAWGRKLS